MADWLLIVPASGGLVARNSNTGRIASVLCSPTVDGLRRTDFEGATFFFVHESRDDPGVVVGPSGDRMDSDRGSAIVASALLTEREDLVASLRSAGYDAAPKASDGVLLAHAVQAWGDAAFVRPGGEFAVAAWLPSERTVLLATDGEGARPVFWSHTAEGLVASTRFDALTVAPLVPKEPDRTALFGYLALIGEHPESARTWLRSVKELPSGHVLRWHNGRVRCRRWWTFPSGLDMWTPRKEVEAIDRFRITLRQSVRERLRDRSRVAIALSGGMDSTAIAAEVCALRDHEGLDLDVAAVHAVYADELDSQEASFARAAADELGLRFVEVPVGSAPVWPMAVQTRSWPPHHWLGQWERFATALAAEGSAVLTGATGEIFSRASLSDALERGRFSDILFAGRALPKAGMAFQPWRRSWWRRTNRPLAQLAHASLPPPSWIRPGVTETHRADALRDELASWAPDGTPTRFVIMHTFLVALRRSSHMFDHGLTRLPLLNPFADRRVVRLAVSINPVPWRMQKYLARRALENVLPRSVVRRRRTPTPWLARPFFGSPAAHQAAQNPLHPVVLEMIDRTEWRSRVDNIKTHVEGRAWLAPLVASLWLRELEGRA